VVYHKEKPGLQRIKEVQSTTPLNSTLYDIRKTSLALFLSEFLLNAFKNQEAHPETFDFVLNVVKKLDVLDRNLGVFHIVFMVQLSKYLGFAPSRNFSAINCFFNLREGIYQKQYDNGLECLDQEESNYFYRLSGIEILEPFELKISAAMRNKLLTKCINYYRMHMDGFGEMKSVEVLEEVFR
jgi:DNA repair protein RecO (recombination protein O)